MLAHYCTFGLNIVLSDTKQQDLLSIAQKCRKLLIKDELIKTYQLKIIYRHIKSFKSILS